MARRKNQPEVIRIKNDLADRLREVRMDLYGDRGGSEMARRLGIPIRTWYNYEGGVTVPAEVILRFVELTNVEPVWLLHGRGPRYRVATMPGASEASPSATVESLLRSALQHLEKGSLEHEAEHLDNGHSKPGLLPHTSPTGLEEAQRTWLKAQQDGRIVEVIGDAMAPVVLPGALVAFSEKEEAPEDLDGVLVVAWLKGEPEVRWYRLSGAYGLLKAENPKHSPSMVLLDLKKPGQEYRVRRVLWISNPKP